MTDFLEELLKQQVEEEEDEVLLRLPHRSVQTERLHSDQPKDRFSDAGWADAEKADAGIASAGLAGAPGTVALERQRGALKKRVSEMSSRGLQPLPATAHTGNQKGSDSGSRGANLPVLALWDKVKRTNSAARLWQVRTVRPESSTFGTAGHANGEVSGLAKQGNIIPGYAALVDAAFARDARRYDGPLRIL